MSPFPLTFLCLALIAAALLFLRSRWGTLGNGTRRAVLGLALLSIAFLVWAYATHWVTISDRVNCGFYWAAITGYLVLLTIHSLNRPRWLTSLSALILAAPVLSTTLLFPMLGLFGPSHRRVVPLGHQLFASWEPFREGASSSGVDLDISYRPRFLPFMRHSRLGGRFYSVSCNGEATEVRLEPDAQSVFVRCPPWPNSGITDSGRVLLLH